MSILEQKPAKKNGIKPNRKAYEKPAVSHREVMESIAGGCDSTHPVNGKTGVGDNCTSIGS
jgi:hypothetical protein